MTGDAGGEAPRAPFRRDAAVIGIVALAPRLALVAWAAGRFPPIADGTFYQRIAERIAEGLGYTWLWPDGAVTYAAHYPVGYPAALGAVYAIAGPRLGAAMTLHAALGALAALLVHRLVARTGSRRAAAIAGLLAALHPGLLAYTPAIMTEGVTASLLVCAAWAAARARDALDANPAEGPVHSPGARSAITTADRRAFAAIAASGLLLGLATLVRPQSIALAPVFGWLAWAGRERPLRAPIAAAAVCVLAALLVCAPWTARNCVRMKSCALVSVNGGWNLLIGADQASTGAWSPVKVPEACREVFDEAGKDACFGREARRYIAENAAAWLALVPRKLAATFDYCGAGGAYMHTSNPAAFSERAKTALFVVELGFERAMLLLSIAWAARGLLRARGPRSPWSFLAAVVAAVGVAFLFLVHAWVSYAAFALLALLRGRALTRGPIIGGAAVAVLGATLLTHAVFFGAGRYSLVVFPMLCGTAALGACGMRLGLGPEEPRAAPSPR